MMITPDVGSINAILNVLVWVTQAVLSILVESIYFRLSSRQLKQDGETHATDISDMRLSSWLLKRNEHMKKRKLKWWAFLLMLLLTLLLPAEILLESGIYERHDCSATTMTSHGVCSSPWNGQGNVFISSTCLLTAYSNWVDLDKWEVVLEGSRKRPRISEVRMISALKPGRRVVLSSCDVRATRCRTQSLCGTLKVRNSKGTYGIVVTSSTVYNHTGGSYMYGDVESDGHKGVAFMFWAPTRQQQSKEMIKPRKTLSVMGIETSMSEDDSQRMSRMSNDSLILVARPSSTRLYDIRCDSDGLLAEDLARAVGIYRTMQTEQFIARQNRSRIQALSSSDVLKSAYALKSADGSDSCTGNLDVYNQCGDFKTLRMLPFVIGSAVLGIGWIFVKVIFPASEEEVPVHARSWRLLAHNQSIALRLLLQSNFGKKASRDQHGIFDRSHVSKYCPGKFGLQVTEALALVKSKEIVNDNDIV